jgi:diguanylate cyclase (GGDEF)-like protein
VGLTHLVFALHYARIVSQTFNNDLLGDSYVEIITWIGVLHIANFLFFSIRQAQIMSTCLIAFISGYWAYHTLFIGYFNVAEYGYNAILDLSTSGIIMMLMLSILKRFTYSLAHSEARAEALNDLANKDSLTGLYNRRYLDQSLAQEFVRARHYQQALSIVLCDIDFFKTINDQLSHAVGDETLKTLATIIKQNTRETDIVSRYGGEEFVIVFPQTPLEQALNLSERIRHAIERHEWFLIHPDLQVTASFGVCDDLSLASHEKMLNAADKKLYEAKQNGKNQVKS